MSAHVYVGSIAYNIVAQEQKSKDIMISPELHDDDSIMALQALLKIKKANTTSVHQEDTKIDATVASVHNNSIIQDVTIPSYSLVHDGDAANVTSDVKPMMVTSSVSSVNNISHDQCLQFLSPDLLHKSVSSIGISPIHKHEDEEGKIRKEIIAAALLSKPQRGRKRDNLNVFERMELTRTRNREHAKSTRIRKKARYQELVDKENLYNDLMHDLCLQKSRRDVIKTFITCREALLRQNQPSEIDLDYRKLLKTTIANELSFTLEVKENNENNSSVEEDLDTMTRMDKLENSIRSKVGMMLGHEAISSIEYRVVGGWDAIALGKSDIALVEIEVVTKDHDKEEVIVLRSVVRWSFAPDSPLLLSMQWTTVSDYLVPTVLIDPLKTVESSKNLLAIQMCYPSLVSLEHGSNISEPRQFQNDS